MIKTLIYFYSNLFNVANDDQSRIFTYIFFPIDWIFFYILGLFSGVLALLLQQVEPI